MPEDGRSVSETKNAPCGGDSASQNQVLLEIRKWEAEKGFREREVAVKEAELEVSRKSGWSNPLVVAIFAASVAALGNAVIAVVNGHLQRDVEAQKAEQTRILEMIKTGDPDKAAANLDFLLQAGLIDDQSRAEKIKIFLKSRSPGSGPVLPSSASIAIGDITDHAVRTDLVNQTNPLKASLRAVGQLRVVQDAGGQTSCTAFAVADDMIMTSAHCVSSMNSGLLHMTDPDRDYPVKLPPLIASGLGGEGGLDYALVQVLGKPGIEYGTLKLGTQSAHAGQLAALILFRVDKTKLVVLPTADCAVINNDGNTITHTCSSGGGSAGGPLLDSDGKTVIGVHWGRDPQKGGQAADASAIVKEIRSKNPGFADRVSVH